MSISMINGTFFCECGQTGWYLFWIGYKKKKKQRLWLTWSFLTGMSERRNIFRINNINIKGEVKKCYISLKFHLISASCNLISALSLVPCTICKWSASASQKLATFPKH